MNIWLNKAKGAYFPTLWLKKYWHGCQPHKKHDFLNNGLYRDVNCDVAMRHDSIAITSRYLGRNRGEIRSVYCDAWIATIVATSRLHRDVAITSRRRDYVATISRYIGSRHRTIRDVDCDVCCDIARRHDKFDVATNVAICRDFKQINIIIIWHL